MITVSIEQSDAESVKPQTELQLKEFSEHCQSIKSFHKIVFSLLDPTTKDPFFHGAYITGQDEPVADYLIHSFTHYFKNGKLTKQEYETVLQWFEDSEVKTSGSSSFIKKKTKKRSPPSPLFSMHVKNVTLWLWTKLIEFFHLARRFLINSYRFLKKCIKFLSKKWKEWRKDKAVIDQQPEEKEPAEKSKQSLNEQKGEEEGGLDPASSKEEAQSKSLDEEPIILSEEQFSELVGKRIDQRLSFVETQMKKKEREIERMGKAHDKALKKEKKKQAILIRELERKSQARQHSASKKFFSWILRLLILYFLAYLIVIKLNVAVPKWFYVPGDKALSLLEAIDFKRLFK